MNRRQALILLLALAAGVPAARVSSAQSAAKVPVVGLLDAGERREWWTAFRDQLRELGYVEGKTVALETRFAEGRFDRLPALAQELIRLKVAVVVTSGRVAARAASDATRTVPIVMATGDDPVTTGLVASLARPGGNVTGVTSLGQEVTTKRFELLQELMPRIARLAVLWHKDNPASESAVRQLQSAAKASKVALQILAVKTTDEFAGAFAAMTRTHAQAVFVVTGPAFFQDRERLATLALKHHLPSMYTQSEYVDAGGLLAYGPNYPDLFRRAALYVDKILKGAKPGDLPIEQPTKFELVINARTARALGMTIPNPILLRADRTIE